MPDPGYDDEDLDLNAIFGGGVSPAPPPAADPGDKVAEELALPVQRAPLVEELTGPGFDDDDDEGGLGAFMAGTGLKTEAQFKVSLAKPWMKYHHFNLVKTVEEVREIVDKALAHGRCALDLETQGFDNRIDYIDGKPVTRHKIVGFCISVKGVGYYIPVRHKYDPVFGQKNPNVTPIREVEAEISRLCHEAQPVLTEEGLAEDPLGSPKIETPPRVLIYFWNAFFDQEFLFPLTGIDYWHPESFEDGMLAAYTVLSEDKQLGLKAKASQRLFLWDEDDKDGQGNPLRAAYEMIEFKDLFPTRMKKSERKFGDLYPEDGSAEVLYGCSDAICTEMLCERRKVNWDYKRKPPRAEYRNVVKPARTNRFKGTYRLEKQAAQPVRVMERTRTLIDKEEIQRLLTLADEELDRFDEQIKAVAKAKGFKNFNPGSSQQISDLLFSRHGLDIKPKPEMTEGGANKEPQYKTDADTLERLAEETGIEVLKLFVKRRQVEKVKGTYLLSMGNNTDELNQLRFKFKQIGAATGRFSGPKGNPDHGDAGIPIQGIPARYDPDKPAVANSLRRVFVAHEGYTWCKIDYAGQELRIVTNLSKEPVWLKEFLEGTGDLHTITAKAFFGDHITKANKLERSMAKAANFAMVYGGGVSAIMRATKCDKMEASRRKANFDQSVSQFAKWVKNQHGLVKRLRGVVTAFGRFIAIPDANIKVGQTDSYGKLITDERDARRIRAGCERKSTNYPIQGSGADILKISLVKLIKELTRRKWLKNGGDDSVRMLMTVHDEICFEIKHERLQEALEVICRIMQSPGHMAGWRVPLIVEPEVGLNWEAKHDFRAIMKGETEVPEWLQGHVTPDPEWVTRVDARPAPKAKKASPAPPPPEDTLKDDPTFEEEPEVASGPSSDLTLGDDAEEPTPPTTRSQAEVKEEPVSEKEPSTRQGVANFTLPWSFLPRSSLTAMAEAIGGSLPMPHERKEARLLRLLDQMGETLIDPKQRVWIVPDRFARKLRDRGYGPGHYELTPE